MYIGNIKIDGVVALGPMAGITTESYRRFMKPYGVALSYTEMISDCGIIYRNQETFTYLPSNKSDHPVALQLFGSSKETLLQALAIIEQEQVPYDILDINLGCPMPKVTKIGGGSSWLTRPQELFEMMSLLVKNSPKPVTAKIRLGWDENSINFFEIIHRLEEAGVAAIALHVRTRAQMYSGFGKYELVENLRSKMRVPLIISGDIFTLDDAVKARNITGAEMVMVARGGVGHPHLIQQIDHYYKTGVKLNDASLQEQIVAMKHLLKLSVEDRGEKRTLNEMRGTLPKFLTGYPHTKKYRVAITSQATSIIDIENILLQVEKDALSV